MKYPNFVKKFKPKGTVVKKINGNFYAYNAASKRVPDKKYPVQIVSGIAGKIDENDVRRNLKGNNGILRMPYRFIPINRSRLTKCLDIKITCLNKIVLSTVDC